MKDIRTEAARYYDLNPNLPDDIPFYRGLIPHADSSILELGCGTGRVLVSLARSCGFIQGIDRSEAMLAICRERLRAAGVHGTIAGADAGDVTAFDLERSFDLALAPFRVFQNLETDEEVEGFFRCVRKHLAPGGSCVLNVFRPNMDLETLRREWCTPVDRVAWEASIDGDRVVCYDRRPRMDPENLVLYPELIYRRYSGKDLRGEVVLELVMRCYYPDQFEKLIVRHGFSVQNRWGGYAGERYGEGPELIVSFV
jgi:SAM-dependent methyltransferase